MIPRIRFSNGIAELVYGEEVFNRERRGGPKLQMGPKICYAAKSSLSRSLNGLWKKGIVKKGLAEYNSFWYKEEYLDGSKIGYWTHEVSGLELVWINKQT